MGLLSSDVWYVIDYMLGTINIYYLLFNFILRKTPYNFYLILSNIKINYFLLYLFKNQLWLKVLKWGQNLKKIDISWNFNFHLNRSCLSLDFCRQKRQSKSNNKSIQSAGNLYMNNIIKGSSETIRQLSKLKKLNSSFEDAISAFSSKSDIKFIHWFAGIIDGDGNFDLRKESNQIKLKSIRIKLHNRDLRILTRIQNNLNFGKIRYDKNKPYSIYIISKKEDMKNIINLLNGIIKIKISAFKKACSYFNIQYIEPNYNLEALDPYFSGLIDTDGSIIFNYASNRIECNLELKYNEYSSKLCFDNVIPNYKPSIYFRDKKNQTPGRIFKSIVFKYQTVNGMIFLYNYFMINRLYSDFKFYRISKIKQFIKIRQYKTYPKNSLEFKIYSHFLLDFIKNLNPLWNKVPFVKYLFIKNLDNDS